MARAPRSRGSPPPPPPTPGPRFSTDPSPEALNFFRNKTSQPSFDWRDVWAEEHAHAFTVAKATRVEVLETIRRALDDALTKGMPFEQFAKELSPKLRKLGWWGRKEVVDPETGKRISAQLGSPRRLQIIFDANIRSAHAAGQWERAQRTKKALPFFLYVQTTSVTPREEHLDQVGTIAEVDDPYWDTWFPPNGWQCKCSVRQITQAEAESLGWKPGKAPPDVPTRPWLNKRTGEIEDIPVGIDPGWQRNPAKRRRANLDELLSGTLDNVDPALRAAALKDLPSSWLFARIVKGELYDFDNAAKIPNVAAPIGHVSGDLRAAHGLKSGVVWVTPDKPFILNQAVEHWALLPRIIDEGAVVRSRPAKGALDPSAKGWLVFYRKIDGRYWRAEVSPRDLTPGGETIKGGRLNLENFRSVDAKTFTDDLTSASAEGRLLRAEARRDVNLYNLKPASLGAAAVPKGTPPEGRGDGKSRLKPVADKDARETVLQGGRATNKEWGYAYDGSGRHLATWSSGERQTLQIDGKLLPELLNPKARVVLHHNHPANSSFSDQDLAIFDRLPGLHELVANGHDGSTYRVVVKARGQMASVVALANKITKAAVRAAVEGGVISFEDASALIFHLRTGALHRAGLLQYESELRSSMGVIRDLNATALDRITKDIADDLSLLLDR